MTSVSSQKLRTGQSPSLPHRESVEWRVGAAWTDVTLNVLTNHGTIARWRDADVSSLMFVGRPGNGGRGCVSSRPGVMLNEVKMTDR
jgi:hypothetical protein